jgi:hypothetical protein
MTWRNLLHAIQRQFSIWHFLLRSCFGSLLLPSRVCGCEELTTFVVSRKHVNWETGFVREEHFHPRRVANRLETSVIRTTALNATTVWDICTQYFDPRQRHAAIGRGIGPARVVFEQDGLSFDPDGIPHPTHANIVGWRDEPGRPEKEIKHHWKHAAQRIAAKFPYEPR